MTRRRFPSRFERALSAAALAALFLGCSEEGPESSDESTWYEDVLPIARKRCFACHSEGGVGAFVMDVDARDEERYEDIRAAARFMVLAVDAGHMPPWQPDPSCRSYRDERLLDESEKRVFRSWQEQGAPRGDPADAPAPPEPASLPRVDLSLSGVGYLPDSIDGMDVQCFVLDPALFSTTDLAGLRVVPGSRRVHDVLVYTADRAAAEAADAADEAPGFDCFGPPEGAGLVGSWVPSAPPLIYPPATGIQLEPQAVFVLQVYYDLATGLPEQDATGLELMFADSPLERAAVARRLGNDTFVLPPMSRNLTAEASSTFDEPGTLWAVAATLGVRGRGVEVRLSGPSGERCVLAVPIFRVDWQELYFVSDPMPFEAGESVQLGCRWDNSSMGEIGPGPGRTDERCVAELLTTAP